MDISEVLIEENNQTNKRPARRRDAGYLSEFSFFFSLGILHFTLPTFYSFPLCCIYRINSNPVESNIITHLVHIVIIIIISLSSPPPPRQSVQPSHPAKEDNKYIYKTVRDIKLS